MLVANLKLSMRAFNLVQSDVFGLFLSKVGLTRAIDHDHLMVIQTSLANVFFLLLLLVIFLLLFFFL